MKYLVILLIVGFNNFCYSQISLDSLEKDLCNHFSKISYWYEQQYKPSQESAYDSISEEGNIFFNKLLKYTSSYPLTITKDFKSLEGAGLDLVTSDDHMLRIYSWDTYLGGTMHDFDNVVQYKVGKKTKSLHLIHSSDGSENDPGSLYPEIYTLHANNKTYYLVFKYAIGSTKDRAEGIKFLCIENNHLNDTVGLIKTKTGIHNEIGFGYDFFSTNDQSKTLSYDSAKKEIHIPVVLENGRVTKKYIAYHFTGKYFEKIK